MLKTVGLAEPLRDALKPLTKAIRAAFVYGSVAKATQEDVGKPWLSRLACPVAVSSPSCHVVHAPLSRSRKIS